MCKKINLFNINILLGKTFKSDIININNKTMHLIYYLFN